MDNELNPSNLDTIVRQLWGPATTPSVAEMQALMGTNGSGLAPGQSFDLLSQGGMANTFLNPQERLRNDKFMEKMLGAAE